MLSIVWVSRQIDLTTRNQQKDRVKINLIRKALALAHDVVIVDKNLWFIGVK
jgi:hypothetical protein